MASSAASTIQRPLDRPTLSGPSPSPQMAVQSGADASIESTAAAYVAPPTSADSTSTFSINSAPPSRPPSNMHAPNDSASMADSFAVPSLPPSRSSTQSLNGVEDAEVDEAIIQALKSSKERLYMLMLGESMETLISARSPAKPFPSKTFSPTTTYHRLLIHRCSQYYRCTPEVDTVAKTITVFAVVDSRLPSRRISELVPAESATSTPFKIMRRATPEQRSKGRSPGVASTSSTSSTSAVDTSPSIASGSQCSDSTSPSLEGIPAPDNTQADDESDAVLRSLGLPPKQNRNNPGGGANTPRKTIEEREAAYNEARTRIFMDFEEKEKAAAKLRADREREREVTELHRELADQESHQTEVVPDGLSNVLANGRLPYPRPATVGPIETDVPLRVINGAELEKPKDRSAKPSSYLPNGNTVDPNVSIESEASMVSYPTLYDADVSQDPQRATVPNPQLSQPYHPPPPPPTAYDPNAQPYPSHVGHPNYGGSYPYGVGMNGMPPMNGGPPPVMGNYPPYPPMPPTQQQPHMAINHPMMGMGPYPPYYPQIPPPNNWGDGQMYPPHGAPDGHHPPPETGYPMYPHPNAPPPQQQPYWPPPNQQPPHAHEMPPPPPPSHMYAPNGSMNGANYPPPNPYYNPAIQPQPYPPPQNPPYPPPQGPHQYPQSHQYNPQHRGPPAQQSRQLWTPANSGAESKRGGHGRNSFSNQQRGNRGGNNSQGNTGGRGGNNQRAVPGAPLRQVGENPKDYGPGPASLIATPMSGSSSYSGSRSRNSSISSVSRTSIWSLGNPSNITDGFAAPSFGFGMRPSGSSQGGSLNGAPIRMGMGDRKRSGSTTGSVAESISVAGEESGTMTPLDETASMASSSMSSASSSRTFTSTSSKHPSLPARPDWAVGLFPGTHGPGSSHSSTRGKSAGSSNSSNPAHSRTHSFQSQGRPSSYSILQPTDFPPLPGVSPLPINISPQRQLVTTSAKNTVWNGNPRTALTQTHGNASNQGRLDEPDAKYTRPPSKGSAALFDHKQTGRASNARAATPVDNRAVAELALTDAEAANRTVDGHTALDKQMAQLSVADQAVVETAPATAAAA